MKATTEAPECDCWILHATTPEHRAQVQRRLEYSHRIGDTTGVWIFMAQLSPCPKQTAARERS